MRSVRYLSWTNVWLVAYLRLLRPEYAEILRSLGSNSRQRVARATASKVTEFRTTTLQETEIEYRREVARNLVCPFAWVLVLMTAVLNLAAGTSIVSGIPWAFVILISLFGIFDALWRAARGWLWADWCPRWTQSRLRRGRIGSGDFQVLLTMGLSAALNAGLYRADAHDKISAQMKPQLRELKSTLLRTNALTDIRDRVIDRPGLVLGVSGSRGAGKTFALEYLRRFQPQIGEIIFLRLPSPHARADLAKFLLAAVADRLAGPYRPSQMERLATRARVAAAIALIMLVVTVLLGGTRSYVNALALSPRPTGLEALGLTWDALALAPVEAFFVVAAGVLLVTVSVLFALWLHVEGTGPAHTRALARDVLANLRFDDEKVQEAGMQLAFTAGAQVGANLLSRRSRRGRPVEVGDVYATFERLVDSYLSSSRKRLLIIVDELDRYDVTDVGSATLDEALNEIKPFFLVRGVSAVMSISSQAAQRYRNRGDIATLGVLDSTFDEVVEIPPWTKTEMSWLLNCLIVGLREDIINQIHEMSKGRPREAVRIAWMVCRLRNRRNPVPLEIRVAGGDANVGFRIWEECLELVRNSLGFIARNEVTTHEDGPSGAASVHVEPRSSAD